LSSSFLRQHRPTQHFSPFATKTSREARPYQTPQLILPFRPEPSPLTQYHLTSCPAHTINILTRASTVRLLQATVKHHLLLSTASKDSILSTTSIPLNNHHMTRAVVIKPRHSQHMITSRADMAHHSKAVSSMAR